MINTTKTSALPASLVRGREGREAWLELMRIGSGPWKIEQDCPSLSGHNTINAARGVGATRLRCTCPRARFLLEKYLRDERLRRLTRGGREGLRQRKAQRYGATVSDRLPALLATKIPREGLDLSAGLCRDAVGQKRSDAAFGSESGVAAGAIGSMKRLCAGCPVQQWCAATAVQGEIKAGEWGGVYGGLSSSDRIRIAATPLYKQWREQRDKQKEEAAA